MSARTVLIISYHYAPSPAVGAKRFSFLAREFTNLGYDVHVITNENAESPLGASDTSLPLAGTVHRAAAPIQLPRQGRSFAARAMNWLLRRLLAPVGWDFFWSGPAADKAVEVARGLEPGVIIATSPPHAALFAGVRAARRLGWPLILDYRDPWSAYDWPRWRRGSIAQWVARRIEARLIARSDARILNTPAMKQWFERVFPGAPNHQNVVVPNGFDALPFQGSPAKSGPLTLLHAGEIFTGRSLIPILRAVRTWNLREGARPMRVVTLGNLPAREWDRIRAGRYEAFIEVRPRVPFAALASELERAHVLLAVVGEHMLYSTPYKVYDYMAAGRPILGLAPAGAALFDLLEDSGAGICVKPDDAIGLDAALRELIRVGTNDSTRSRTQRFRWPNLAAEYAKVIEAVATPKAPINKRGNILSNRHAALPQR
jgi:glycosyltransferase involved in cell wall biosynthesis